ncbi:DUF1707 domain-containing protein [Streptomyces sp. NPDC059080]|uniref:DUF1707 SHOCT-like domain-containing protein n=1 Tax=Streptomyces sp. NPDC059080 TaxID=3346718 RepID=UPI0036803A84
MDADNRGTDPATPAGPRDDSGRQPARQERRPVDMTKPVAEADLRASDADRDRIAEILREALAEGRLDAEEHAERIDVVYRAKTLGELEPMVRDLPAPGHAGHTAPQRPAAEAHAAPVPDQSLVAVFSASTRKGRWRVPARINAVAIFGSVEIDLTEALFPQQQVQINVTAIFGSVEIRVPENLTLRSSGSGVLGSFEVATNDAVEPDAPVVQVNGYAVLGSVEARPKRGVWVRDLIGKLRDDRHQLREQLREDRRDRHEARRAERYDRHDRFRKDGH